MKKFLAAVFLMAALSTQAQKNSFLDQAFWRNKPDIATVQAEMAKGNSPYESNPSGFDGVVYAINLQAPTEVILYLLDQKGADINKLTHDARTYIFWAANRGNEAVVEHLIKKGAKLNIEDSHGATPISFAAGAGQQNTKVYDALLKGGSDIRQKNADGASLLLLCIANDKDQTLTNYFVSKGLSLLDKDANGSTAFDYVARSGNIEQMKALVQKGVKYTPNAMIMASQGGGRGAVSNSGLPVFQYLESLGLKPTAISKNGENALHGLVRKPNQAEAINWLLSKGVNPAQADREGNTPFMNAAAANRDTAILAQLLAGVKDINQVNGKGVTALALAVKGNTAAVVDFLARKGANLQVTDADGNNLTYYLLQGYSAGGGERQGGGDLFAEKLTLLAAKGFALTAPQKDGNTIYHLAVTKNDLGLLRKIESLKADVNAKNKEGLTPLHKAALVAKDDAILKYLLSIGAKKEGTTSFNETAYELAKENEYLSKTNVSVDFLK